MATEYKLKIIRHYQGRKKANGDAPPPVTNVMYEQQIEQHQIADVVRLLNTKPGQKVSSDGVVSEVVKS